MAGELALVTGNGDNMNEKNNDSFGRHFVVLCLTMVFSLSVCAALNVVVDPFGVYANEWVASLKIYSTERGTRTSKAEVLHHKDPGAVILGSSRVEVGYDPEHPCLQQWLTEHAFVDRTVNLGLAGTNIYETEKVLNAVLETPDIRLVAICVDLLMFSNRRKVSDDFDQSRFNEARLFIEYHIEKILSARSTWASLMTIIAAMNRQQSSRNDLGFRFAGKGDQGAKSMMTVEIRRFSARPDLYGAFEYDRHRFQILEEMVKRCNEAGVVTVIIINPIHLAQLMLIDDLGLWPDFDEFKRDMASLSSGETFENSPVRVLDGAYVNEFTTERVPESGPMTWYWESSHFRKELGDLILENACRLMASEKLPVQTIARAIDAANVELHLKTTRTDFEQLRGARSDLDDWIHRLSDESASR